MAEMKDGKYPCHERAEARRVWQPHEGGPAGLEECREFQPGYVCRDRGMKGHGLHGMEVRWLLRGPNGGAQFVLFTDWLPGRKSQRSIADLYPMGADVGYHSPVPRFDGHDPMFTECDLIPGGGPCYYDGSGMRAETLTEMFKVAGEPVIWAELESVYDELTDAAQNPQITP